MRQRPVIAAAALAISACVNRPPRVTIDPVAREWATTIVDAQQSAESGAYRRADTLLARFAANAPATAEGLEALYWRGLLAGDPRNADADPRAAIARFDEYLAATMPQPRREEATLLRRSLLLRTQLVRQLDSTRAAAAAATAVIVSTREADARAKAAEDELQRMRDTLTRTTAELDRIRRRLGGRP